MWWLPFFDLPINWPHTTLTVRALNFKLSIPVLIDIVIRQSFFRCDLDHINTSVAAVLFHPFAFPFGNSDRWLRFLRSDFGRNWRIFLWGSLGRNWWRRQWFSCLATFLLCGNSSNSKTA